jgi:D-sedoheptulose 7-phosphate isomerase
MPEHESLQGLYPFLHGGRQDADKLDAALLESVHLKAQDSVGTKRRFFEANGPAVVAVAHAIAGVYRHDGRLFTMGNGGSSCDAAHIAVEFLHPVTTGRPALTAINLVADTAMMTAVGNDVGFSHIFVRQLVAQARRGDALIGVSTSGNSENLLAAFAKGRAIGLLTIGLSGHDGGKMAAIMAWLYRATASIAYRRRTSRFTTSCGTWCTRCWPMSAVVWRKEGSDEIRRRVPRSA